MNGEILWGFEYLCQKRAQRSERAFWFAPRGEREASRRGPRTLIRIISVEKDRLLVVSDHHVS